MFGGTVPALDRAHAEVGAAERRMLGAIANVDRDAAWRGDGARDLAHWLCMRYGISTWKALRWIGAAHALERLPKLSEALGSGALGLDKVCELCRFATPGTEVGLIGWARDVSGAAVRRRADVEVRASIRETRDAHRDRFLRWWWADDGRRLGMEAELPAADGQVVLQALEGLAAHVPTMPDEEGAAHADARRADALVALCSSEAGNDPDRATVVVHAKLEGLVSDAGGCELERGPAIHPHTVRRLLCNASVQTVVEDANGRVVALDHRRREPPAWMVRQVRYRDRGCRFPGCGARMFTEAHHIRWWRHGGRTTLENLLLICSFHHRLVHELGWSVRRDADGQILWSRPDGARHRAGPSPGVSDPEQALGEAIAS